MSKKQEKRSQEMTSPAVSELCSFLKKAQPNDTNLRESLRAISEYLSASGSVLFRLKHEDEAEPCQIEEIGSWSPANLSALSLDSTAIPDSLWQTLKRGKMVHFCPAENPGSETSFLLLPIFLEDHLSCLIALRNFGKDGLPQEVRQFLECVIHLFELWLSKMNISKRLDDLINFLPYAVIGVGGCIRISP